MMTHDSDFSSVRNSARERSLLRSRLTLLGLIATFIVPLLLAAFLYARLDIWKPATYVNHGRLMEPVAPLSFLQASARDGQVLNIDSLTDRWSLVYLGEGVCGIGCQSQLFKMRQSRAMLGRDLVRVQTVYLALSNEAMASFDSLVVEYPAMQSAEVARADTVKQLGAFSSSGGGRFYLLDPHGNLVLEYNDTSTTKGVVKDLKRLLKVSNIG